MKSRFLRIAVTGPIASGKSTAVAVARAAGYAVIDADREYHTLLRSDRTLIRRLTRAFGQGICRRGKISRPALRRAVAERPAALAMLERITHPTIIRRIERLMKAARTRSTAGVVVAVPLLFELGLQDRFDIVITLRCRRTEMMRRLKRRGVPIAEVRALLRRQQPLRMKERASDFVIDTTALSPRQFASLFRGVLERLRLSGHREKAPRHKTNTAYNRPPVARRACCGDG